ncbi:MAG: metal-binding protein [bacterium]
MPSGRTHDIITAITTPIVGYLTYTVSHNITDTIILLLAFLFASLMFNGDLDIDSRPYRRWSILRFIWLPYRKLFDHRSIWTHGILIGTIIRLFYVSPIILFVVLNLNINFTVYLTIFIGLEIGNSLHTISDKIWSTIL